MHNHQIKAARIPFPLCSTTGVLRRKLGSVTYSLFTDCFNLFPHLGAVHKVIADCFILFQSVKYPHGPPKRFGKKQTELLNLRALAATPPKTKSGQVVWAWPEIQASLRNGRNLKEIWEALQLDGLVMSYDQFRVYVSRARKRLSRHPEMIALFKR